MSNLSLMLWIIFASIVAIILFSVFYYFLGCIYPPMVSDKQFINTIQDKELLTETPIDEHDIIQRQRKLVGLFVLVAIIVIMATSGINAFMNKY